MYLKETSIAITCSPIVGNKLHIIYQNQKHQAANSKTNNTQTFINHFSSFLFYFFNNLDCRRRDLERN